ncbi:MAG: hypothetical protein ACJ752_09425 [Gaiellaceae bacterium]
MSDEQRTEDEAEVEAHRRKKDANSEPQDEDENEVEAHVRYSNVRMD